jgi:anti-anti-sigma regulatory factor
VRALVRRGARDIVLNLAGVSRIDAAGVGELVRAFNVTRAADAACRIVESGPWVREILQRVGLFDRLSGHAEWRQAPQAPKGRGGPSPAGPRLAWSNGARVAAAGN